MSSSGQRRRPVVYWFTSRHEPGLGRQADLPIALSTRRPTAVVARLPDGLARRPVTARRGDGALLVIEVRFPPRFSGLQRRAPALAARIEWQLVRPVLRSHGFGDAIVIATTNVGGFYDGIPLRPRLFDLLDPSIDGDVDDYDRKLNSVLPKVDAVLATAVALAEDVAAKGATAWLVPNGGADVLPPDRPPRDGRPPAATFVGTIDDRVDVDLLRAVIELVPHVHFHLAGPVWTRRPATMTAIAERANVTIHGKIGTDARAALLAVSDVGLIPFHPGWAGDRYNTVKMYEYMAAGLPVVATPIRECREEPLVATGSTPEEFADHIEAAIAERAAPWAEATAFARKNRWLDRAEALDELLEARWPSAEV